MHLPARQRCLLPLAMRLLRRQRLCCCRLLLLLLLLLRQLLRLPALGLEAPRGVAGCPPAPPLDGARGLLAHKRAC